jgi:hypothetical protein
MIFGPTHVSVYIWREAFSYKQGSAFAFGLNPVTSQHQWRCCTWFTFYGHRFPFQFRFLLYPPFRHYNLLLISADRAGNCLYVCSVYRTCIVYISLFPTYTFRYPPKVCFLFLQITSILLLLCLCVGFRLFLRVFTCVSCIRLRLLVPTCLCSTYIVGFIGTSAFFQQIWWLILMLLLLSMMSVCGDCSMCPIILMDDECWGGMVLRTRPFSTAYSITIIWRLNFWSILVSFGERCVVPPASNCDHFKVRSWWYFFFNNAWLLWSSIR